MAQHVKYLPIPYNVVVILTEGDRGTTEGGIYIHIFSL